MPAHERTYRTRQGDTWDQIAQETLGDEHLFPELVRRNFEHAEVIFFDGGIELVIPEVELGATPIPLPPWMED